MPSVTQKGEFICHLTLHLLKKCLIYILILALFVVVIILILIWAYLSSNDHHSYRTYETESNTYDYFGDNPSKHEILLENIEELKSYIIRQQNYGEKLKESLHKWGAPDSLLFRNESPLIVLD